MTAADDIGRGTYLKLFDVADGFIVCVEEDEPRIDAAVSAYIASGGTRDVLLDVTMLEGPSYRILASRIGAWFISTPASRRARLEIDQANQAEHTEIRHELGIWDDE